MIISSDFINKDILISMKNFYKNSIPMLNDKQTVDIWSDFQIWKVCFNPKNIVILLKWSLYWLMRKSFKFFLLKAPSLRFQWLIRKQNQKLLLRMGRSLNGPLTKLFDPLRYKVVISQQHLFDNYQHKDQYLNFPQSVFPYGHYLPQFKSSLC